MNFFQKLFGGQEETPEEQKNETEAHNFDVLKYDGVAALRTGQFDYAVTCFQHALDIHDDLEIHDHLSEAFVRLNKLPEAAAELKKLSEAQPDNLAIWLHLANICFMMEDYAEMDQACEKALLVDKDSAEATYLQAEAKKGLGDMISTIALLTKTITLDEKFGAAYLKRGQVLLQMGDVNGADADASWLLEHTQDDEDSLLLKARIERAKKQNQEAIAYYGKVIDANPFAVDAYRERGEVYMEQGDSTLAAEDAKKVIELDPKQTADISGEFSADGIEQRTKDAYKNTLNPFGL